MSEHGGAVVPENTPSARGRGRRSVWLFLRDLLVIFAIALLASVLIKSFLVRSFYIPSGSMEQTLGINDRILVNELEPKLMPVAHGDVVVFRDPGGWLDPALPSEPSNPLLAGVDWVLTSVGLVPDDADDHLVKRVIGLPGDHVVCCNPAGQITINGAAIDELGYIDTANGSTVASQIPFDVTVPPESLWVMGDNRNNSEDSRYHQDLPGGGFVPLDDVTGRAIVISWPADRWTWLDNHADVFSAVGAAPAG